MPQKPVSRKIFKLISVSLLLILFLSIVFTALCLKTTALSSTSSYQATDLQQAEMSYQRFGETNYEFLWNKSMNAYSGGVVVDSENFVYAAIGNLTGTTIYKYNMEGAVIWSRLWNYKYDAMDIPHLIAVDNLNNVIIAGITTNLSGYGDIYIVKYSPEGVPLWNVTWATEWTETLNDISVDSGNNIWVVGTYQEEMGGSDDAFLIRYDPLGNILLNKTWGVDYIYDYARCCAVDESYRCYVGTDGFTIMVFNTLGNQIWNTSWGESSELPSAIEIDGEGNFYVVGSSFALPSGPPSTDIFIVKFNSTGGVLWHRFWGTYDYIENNPDLKIWENLIYIVGSDQTAMGYQLVVIAYDSEGNQPWYLTIDLDGSEIPTGIDVDALGNIYVTGNSNSPNYAFIVLIHLPTDGGGNGGIPGFGLFFCILVVVAMTSLISRKKHTKLINWK